MKIITHLPGIFLIPVVIVIAACTPNGPVLPVVTSPIEIQFTPPSTSRQESRSILPSDANDIIFMDLNDPEDDKYTLYHTPLGSGQNSIQLQKGNSYAIGLTYNPSLAEDSSYDYINCIGSFFLQDGELNSLPFSTDAESIVNLGSLSYLDSNFNSVVGLDSLSDSTGYSSLALESYGAADLVFRNIMNPDINHDGVYDSDDNSFWRFCTLVDMQINNNQIDFSNPETPVNIPIENFGNFNLRYMLWLWNFDLGFNIFTNYDDLSIELRYYNESGTYMGNFYSEYSNTEGDGEQYYFNIDNYKFEPGDFTFLINEKPILYFKNIHFIEPEDNYNGFIFPIVKCVADSNHKLKTVSWRWLQIRDGEYKDISDPAAIRLMIKDMYFYFWESGESQAYSPEHFGDTYHFYENGSIDVSSYDFAFGPIGDINYGKIMTDFWDIGDNDYSFGYEMVIE